LWRERYRLAAAALAAVLTALLAGLILAALLLTRLILPALLLLAGFVGFVLSALLWITLLVALGILFVCHRDVLRCY